MPSKKQWEIKAPDGTVVARYKRLRDIPSDITERGFALERRVVFFAVRRPDSAKGPQASRPKAREDQPPTVPARRAPDPAPVPGERIDANGNAVRDKR